MRFAQKQVAAMARMEESAVQITLTGRHVDLSADVRAYVEEKANKLPRFYDRIHEIEFVIGHESEQFTAELIVRADRKHTFVASETGPDTMTVVDLIVDKMERQLRRHKEKNRNHKHDGKNEAPTEL